MAHLPISMFETGASSVTASRLDQRFCYCTYVPKGYQRDDSQQYPLAVIVHGSERSMEGYRNAFAAFAEEHQVVILCPMFPQNALHQGDLHSYKLLRGYGVEFDTILLDMVAEVAECYRINSDQFLLYGFSGGGQFSNRFLYAHPDRLLGVSIGAPGTVTLIDDTADYWVGTRNWADLFGKPIDVEAVRKVPVQMVIGDADTWSRWVEIKPTDRTFWMDGANDAGITRVARMEALRDNFQGLGIAVDYQVFPGIAHADETMLSSVEQFFAACLKR